MRKKILSIIAVFGIVAVITPTAAVLADGAIPDNSGVASAAIENGVASIGAAEFEGRKDLTRYVIPDGVTSIGSYAFRNCVNLTSIVIPDSVRTIGSYAFENCTSLKSISVPGSVSSIGFYAFGGCTALKSVAIGEGVTSIGVSAFKNCSALESIFVPASVSSIGTAAFGCCKSLKNISVNKDNNSYSSADGNLFNKDKSTLLQYAIAKPNDKYVIPNGVTSIGASAFEGCENLASVVIPNGVTSIGASAFESCENLASVTIPGSVSSIYYCAFNNGISLKDLYYTGEDTELDGAYKGSENDSLTKAIRHYVAQINLINNPNGKESVWNTMYADRNSNAVLIKEVPVRTGFEFLGWAAEPDAETAQYAPGDTIDVTKGTFTLYPVWDKQTYTQTEKENNDFTITPVGIPEGSYVIMAFYNDEALVNIQGTEYTAGKQLSFSTDIEYDSVKVFVWDSEMRPLTETEDIPN